MKFSNHRPSRSRFFVISWLTFSADTAAISIQKKLSVASQGDNDTDRSDKENKKVSFIETRHSYELYDIVSREFLIGHSK